MQHTDTIIKIIRDITGRALEPYETTVGLLEAGTHGVHRGLYYIYPDVNFYFGKCHSWTATVHGRFHRNHGSKLRADPADLYGPVKIKVQPRIETPLGWREGIATFIYEDMHEYPEYYQRLGPRAVAPVISVNNCKPRVDIGNIPVLVWSMDDTPWVISQAETQIITAIEPYCNNETYRKRHKKQS